MYAYKNKVWRAGHSWIFRARQAWWSHLQAQRRSSLLLVTNERAFLTVGILEYWFAACFVIEAECLHDDWMHALQMVNGSTHEWVYT